MTGFRQIPILDLALAASDETKSGLLEQLRYALTDVGFLYITNHGVDESVIHGIVTAMPALFGLPESAKRSISLDNSPHFLGYSGAKSETTAGTADLREQVEFATELPDDWTDAKPLSERLRGPNQWPLAYPQLRPIVEVYIQELTALGERFLVLVAEALSLPRDILLDFVSDQHRLKLVHYPAVEDGQVGGQGVGPHKDSSGWWTFLLQASPPHIKGLQALNKDGEWIDVPVVPGSFVVNIGQAFEVCTNGVCPATTHRVLAGTEERFSIPFFQGVRRSLTKAEATGKLEDHFRRWRADRPGVESSEGKAVDSPFLKGKYDTWGESQLRTKIRSHQDVGQRFYPTVFDMYMRDDEISPV